MSDTNPENRGGQSGDRAARQSFGEEYRERLVALGRAEERASMARDEVLDARREAQENRTAEGARRGRNR